MAVSPEIQPQTPPVVEIPQTPDLGEKAREAGVETVPETPSSGPAPAGQTQVPVPAAVTPVPAPAAPTGPSITLPSDPVQLTTMSKGNTNQSLTWMAMYWLRMMKKALKKHWNVIVGGEPSSG